MAARTYWAIDGAWKRPGWTNLSFTIDRATLVSGTDMPGPGSCGLLDVALITTTVSTVTTYTSANNGQTIQNTKFNELVKFNGVTGMTFINCWFRGSPNIPTSTSGQLAELIQGTNASNAGILIKDSFLEPQNPNWSSRAVRGHGISLLRCEVRHCTDGYAVVNSAGMQNDHDVSIEQSWFYDTWLASPDPAAAGGLDDNMSHVDVLMQWEGGCGIFIKGNRVNCTLGQNLEGIGTQITSFTDHTPARTGSEAYIESVDEWSGGVLINHFRGNKYLRHTDDSGNVLAGGAWRYPMPQSVQGTSIMMIAPSTANITKDATAQDGTGLYIGYNWLDGGAVGLNFNDYQAAGQPTIEQNSVIIEYNRWGPIDGSAPPSFRLGYDYTMINTNAGARCIIRGNTRTDTGAAFNQVKP